jgi:uncharacterized Zn finger protein (UPF0148 family)
MTCRNCGEEIKDGSTYCPNCGADVMEAVVLSAESIDKGKEYERQEKQEERRLQRLEQKRQQQAQKEEWEKKRASRTPFYENKYAYPLCKITACLAAVFMLVAPFFRWASLRARDIAGKRSAGITIWDLVKRKEMADVILLILILLCGCLMLYFALRDYIQRVRLPEIPVIQQREFWFRVLPVFVGILVVILAVHTKAYKNDYSYYCQLQQNYQAQKVMYTQLYEDTSRMYSWVGRGFGFFSGVFSIVLYIFSNCFKFVLDTLHEDDEPEAANAPGHEQDEDLEPELTATSMEETEAEVEKEQETEADSGEETDADRPEENSEKNPEA